jgi:hypothetical protein
MARCPPRLPRAARALAVLAGLLAGGSARAAASCEAFARDAVAAAQRNVALGCGYGGARWSLDEAGHFRWCAGARQESADAEAAERRNGMANCERCTRFAEDAMVAVGKNVANGCNFTGARWHGDRNGHFRWCMGARWEHVDVEWRHRNHDAEKCETCARYAREAAAAARANRERACGNTGPAWSEDLNGHFSWCWNLESRAVTVSETRARAEALRRCDLNTAARRSDCQRYAGLAVSQQAENRDRRCGLESIRWHDSHQNHFNWCMAVPASESAEHERFREAELTRCRGRQNPGRPPASESCAVSVIVKNDRCSGATVTSDGPLRAPGSSQATGCGSTAERAKERAIFAFQAAHEVCLSEESQPGCCTFTSETVQGCLCQ